VSADGLQLEKIYGISRIAHEEQYKVTAIFNSLSLPNDSIPFWFLGNFS